MSKRKVHWFETRYVFDKPMTEQEAFRIVQDWLKQGGMGLLCGDYSVHLTGQVRKAAAREAAQEKGVRG